MQKALVSGFQLWLQMRIAYKAFSKWRWQSFPLQISIQLFLAMLLTLLPGVLRHLFPYLLNLDQHNQPISHRYGGYHWQDGGNKVLEVLCKLESAS